MHPSAGLWRGTPLGIRRSQSIRYCVPGICRTGTKPGSTPRRSWDSKPLFGCQLSLLAGQATAISCDGNGTASPHTSFVDQLWLCLVTVMRRQRIMLWLCMVEDIGDPSPIDRLAAVIAGIEMACLITSIGDLYQGIVD